MFFIVTLNATPHQLVSSGYLCYFTFSTDVNINHASFQEFYIRENSIPAYDLDEIKIKNCPHLHFGSNAIKGIRNLRNVELSNIQNLQFDEYGFFWDNYISQYEDRVHIAVNMIPSLRVSIKDCHIQQISSYTFQGRIREIDFDSVTIGNIAEFAFSSLLQNVNFHLRNVAISNVHLQAFKKFSTENLLLSGLNAELIPSRTFTDITVNQNFIIENCKFATVRPSAFIVYNPKTFEVRNCNFAQLDGEAFKVATRGSVSFKNNVFNVTNDNAFRGIVLMQEELLNEHFITFDSDTFHVLTRDSLAIQDFTPKFKNVLLKSECDCKKTGKVFKNAEFYDEIQCLSPRNGEQVTLRDFESYECSVIASHATLIIVVCVVLLLLILISTGLVVYFKRSRNSDKYGKNKGNKNGKLSLIVPDGKTYRETEVHVIVEKANLLTTDL